MSARMSSSGAHLEDQEAVTQLAAAMKDGNKDRVIEIVGKLIREDRMERVRSDLKERKKSIVLVDKNRAVDFQNSLMQPYRIGEPIMHLLKYGKLDCYVPSAVCFYLRQRDGKSLDAAHEMMRKRLPCYLKNIKCYTDQTPSKKYETAYIHSKRTNIPVAFYCKTPVSLGEDRLVDVNVLNVVAPDSYISDRSYENTDIKQILKLIGGAIKQKNDRLHEKILKERRLEEKSSKETGGDDAEPKRESRWWNLMAAKNSSQSNEEKEKEKEKVIANKKLVIQLKDMKCGEDKTKKIKTIYYFTNRHLLKNNEENEKRARLIKTAAADNNELFNPKIHEGFFDTEHFDITRRPEPIAFKVNAYMGAWSTLSADADRNKLLREALFVFEWNGASAMGHGVPDEDFSSDPQIQFFNSIGRHSAIAFLAMSIRQPYVGVPP